MTESIQCTMMPLDHSEETLLAHRFVLEGVDPNTNCIAHELTFEIDDLRQLAALLDMDARSFDRMATYPIEADELERLKSALGLTFDAGETEVGCVPCGRSMPCPTRSIRIASSR